jgi:hypothetical protein
MIGQSNRQTLFSICERLFSEWVEVTLLPYPKSKTRRQHNESRCREPSDCDSGNSILLPTL